MSNKWSAFTAENFDTQFGFVFFFFCISTHAQLKSRNFRNLRILNCLQNINEWRNENWNVFLTHTKNKSSKFGKHCIMFYLIGSNFGGLVEFLFQLRQCIFISDEFNWLLEVIPLRFRNEIGFLSGLSQWHFISGFQWYNSKISVKFVQNENTLL